MTRSRPADRRNPRQPRAAGGAEEAVTLPRQWRVPRHAPAVAGRLPLAADLSVSRPPSSAAILSMTSDLFSLPIPGCLMSVPQSSFRSRTVQKLDRGVDGRSCIPLLTDSRRATSHRSAGGTGRDHGVAVPSTAAGSGDGRAPGDAVRGGRARRTRGRRDAASPRRSGPCARGRSP